MRFALPAVALAMALAVTSSMGAASATAPDPRAARLAAEGRTLLANGEAQGAIDAFEAALAIDPAWTQLYLDLADAARAEGLQGKAIRFYRAALDRDPENLAALAGEGQALVEKGALSAANENLQMLVSLCGEACPQSRLLAERIAAGPPVLTAEAVAPDPAVAQN